MKKFAIKLDVTEILKFICITAIFSMVIVIFVMIIESINRDRREICASDYVFVTEACIRYPDITPKVKDMIKDRKITEKELHAFYKESIKYYKKSDNRNIDSIKNVLDSTLTRDK